MLSSNIVPIMLFHIERSAIINHGSPDWYYLYFFTTDENELKKIEAHLQKTVDELCKLFPVKSCPKTKVYTWSIMLSLEIIHTESNPVIIVSKKAIKIFSQKELEAALAHEYGHLFFNTYDQKRADKFAAEAIGVEYTIGFLKKIPQFNSIIISVADTLTLPPYYISRIMNYEITDRIKTLEQ